MHHMDREVNLKSQSVDCGSNFLKFTHAYIKLALTSRAVDICRLNGHLSIYVCLHMLKCST